jgi:hypothetical protein
LLNFVYYIVSLLIAGEEKTMAKKPFFYLPLLENRMNFSEQRNPTFQRYIVRDGVGILILYEQEGDFKEEVLNANNYGIHPTWTVVEAETVVDAIRFFYKEYEGAKVGGESSRQKALRIDTGRKIVQLPPCPLMNREKGGRFVCRDNAGNCFGSCVVGGVADFPSGECPMKKLSYIRSFDFSKTLPKGCYRLLKIIVDDIVYKFAELEGYRRMMPSDQPPPLAKETS